MSRPQMEENTQVITLNALADNKRKAKEFREGVVLREKWKGEFAF